MGRGWIDDHSPLSRAGSRPLQLSAKLRPVRCKLTYFVRRGCAALERGFQRDQAHGRGHEDQHVVATLDVVLRCWRLAISLKTPGLMNVI